MVAGAIPTVVEINPDNIPLAGAYKRIELLVKQPDDESIGDSMFILSERWDLEATVLVKHKG